MSLRSADSVPGLDILIQLVPSGLLDQGLIGYLVVGVHPDCLEGIKCLLDSFNERVTHHVEAQVDCLNGYLMLVLVAATRGYIVQDELPGLEAEAILCQVQVLQGGP